MTILIFTLWVIGYLFTLGIMYENMNNDTVGWKIICGAIIITLVIWPMFLGVAWKESVK